MKKHFRFPAEWEPHEATWLGWPHNETDWPGKMHAIPSVYVEFVKHIHTAETVRMIVESKAHRADAAKRLHAAAVDMDRVEFFEFPTNRGWTRDMGPLFIQSEAGPGIVNFSFNAWAKYEDWQKDNDVPNRASDALDIPVIDAVWEDDEPIVLEGGSIDVNGQGTLITTEECLQDGKVQTRNPGRSKQDYERMFERYLGITHTIWLGKGIAGDDTHGHVDDICRFVGPSTIVAALENHAKDANYVPLRENRERLEGAVLESGSKPEIAYLPMPEPRYIENERVPASYANFYISNAAVLVPTFDDKNDYKAIGLLRELITDRKIVGVDCRDLIWGLGAIHCLTQQQPV